MTTVQKIQIVTVYNAAQSKSAQSRIRTLSVVSLIVAGVWFWATLMPINTFLTRSLLLKAIAGATDTMGQPEPDVWVSLGLKPPPIDPSPPETNAEAATRVERELSILTIEFYAWKALAILAGGWLALAALVGLLGARMSRRMHRQAAWLMFLSTIASVSGIWIAIQWGGMPAHADLPFYAKMAGIQSSYAWFLLIATRFLR
jgi:hypothetical protein